MFKYKDYKLNLEEFYKRKKDSSIWWIEDSRYLGRQYFSFDKDTIFNLHEDYPEKLTKEQRKIFKREFPILSNLFEE